MKEINKDRLTEIVKDKNEVLKRVHYVMVREGYKHSRGTVLYSSIGCGLELQYKIDVSDIMDGANIIVFEDFPERYDITIEEFKQIAFDNTVSNYEARFESVCDILGSIIEGFDDCDLQLYCVTNEQKNFGAGTILYPGMKEKIESVIGDFIIIPSSIHEVLILPDIGHIDHIVSMIYEVNTTTVDEEEILGYRPFKLVSDGKLVML